MTTAIGGSRHPMVLVSTGLGLFMIFLDATIVNVALPEIQADFGGGEGSLQWVVAAYTLTMGMFMMTSASLADRHGRRRAFVVGAVIFGVGSSLCAIAPSVEVLSLARALQGIGAATLNVTSLALVSAAYVDPKAKARAIGAWTGVAAVGLAIGPTLGGVLTDTFGWRSIFVVNVVVCVVAAVLVCRFVEESRDPKDRDFDPTGQLLFIFGIGALTYALIDAPQRGWLSPEIAALLIGAVIVLGVFIAVELRVREPMMQVRLFTDRVYTAAIVTIFAVLFGVYGTFLLVTQYFQNFDGYSAEQTGLLMLAGTVPTIVLAPVAGRLASRIGGRTPTLLGVASATLGLLALAAGPRVGLWLVLVGLAFVGASGGLAVAPATHVAMTSVPEDRAGMASGIMSAQRALGSTAGYAIMGSVLAGVLAASLPAALEQTVPDASARERIVDAVVADASPRAAIGAIGPARASSGSDEAYADAVLADADSAYERGMTAAFLVAAALAAGALSLGFVVFPKGARADEEHRKQRENRFSSA